jgi:CBS domain-containing protein
VDEFVAKFVGADRELKRLGLSTLEGLELPGPSGLGSDDPRIPVTTTLRDALSQVIERGGRPLGVLDAEGNLIGMVTLELLGGLRA